MTCAHTKQKPRRVNFANDEQLAAIRFVENKDDVEPEIKATLYSSAEELRQFHEETFAIVRKLRREYYGDMTLLPCGGRGLEKLQTAHYSRQIRRMKAKVIVGVLRKQQQQQEEHPQDADDWMDRIRETSENLSQWSRIKAQDRASNDEQFVLQMIADDSVHHPPQEPPPRQISILPAPLCKPGTPWAEVVQWTTNVLTKNEDIISASALGELEWIRKKAETFRQLARATQQFSATRSSGEEHLARQ